MTYKQTLNYLFSQLPMFQRVGAVAIKKDLKNTLAICHHLQNPHTKFPSIHIAGTNGKGSVSHMLASIYQEKGLKVGLYTSPHLKDFRERIKINGKLISRNEVISFVKNNKIAFELIKPSFFEWTVGLAFYYFAKKKVDIAIIETGLGGRLDSTNVITPILSVITNIGTDHKELLGNTKKLIAIEKAGIIKPYIPVVIGENDAETAEVFTIKAQEQNAPLFFAEELIKKTEKTDLQGSYQSKNIKTVLTALYTLHKTSFSVSKPIIKKGLLNTIKNTGLRGRWETISTNPWIICDVGHNVEGLAYIVNTLNQLKYNTLHFVIGMVTDKDHNQIIKMLPLNANYYCCKPNIPRGFNSKNLTLLLQENNRNATNCNTVKMALNKAKKNYSTGDLIFVGGSTFVVAEIL